MNLWELPRKISSLREFMHFSHRSPDSRKKFFLESRNSYDFSILEGLKLLKKHRSEFKSDTDIDLAKRTDLNSFGKATGNVTNIG